ncbi:hypothetical protein BU16DRAFT_563999 [Lophium mytilinum]|uniref:Uncharacterized protein n=1 Tax=Lophium mytilinum TaxID=390894 RepID=A0A6A6QL18_9PEZI|nr:hypothetical protein BU16DRAFT_563999 [Lophium mytilinum]
MKAEPAKEGWSKGMTGNVPWYERWGQMGTDGLFEVFNASQGEIDHFSPQGNSHFLTLAALTNWLRAADLCAAIWPCFDESHGSSSWLGWPAHMILAHVACRTRRLRGSDGFDGFWAAGNRCTPSPPSCQSTPCRLVARLLSMAQVLAARRPNCHN